MSRKDGPIIEALSKSDELAMFQTNLVKDLIEYKWNSFAFYYHLFGAISHLIKQIALILYINYVYLHHRHLMKNKDGSLRDDYYVSYQENLLPDDYWKYYIGTIVVMLLYPLYIDG